MVGFLDGIGLALFIPLLKLVIDEEVTTAGEDRISTIVVDYLGIEPDLGNILGLIFIFFALKGIAKFLEGYVRVLYQQYFMRQIRISNINLLNTYNYESFAKSDIGRIQNTFTGEVERINNAFRFYFKAFQYGVLVLVYVVLAFISDPVFSILVAVGGVATNYIFKLLYKKTKMLSRKITTENHLFQGMMIQRVSFFKYLKTTGLNPVYSRRLKDTVYTLERLQLKLGTVDSVLGALREPLIILIVIIAIYLQTIFISNAAGLVILCLLLLYRALTFFMGMQEHWNFFLGLSGSLDNMENFTVELSGKKELDGDKNFPGFREELELQNVGFHYDEKRILKEVDIRIKKNEVIAIVGESGSGKTTLMNIISGLLFPTEGKYLVDGTEVVEYERNSFQRCIGYIPQDSIIFNDTIFNNVTLWAEKNKENMERFRNVITEASMAAFVNEQPRVEETLLGNNGINLSGGQKQRICIARELYKKVQLLLLDEATSALDSKTEAAIQQNIDQLRGHFTIVVIAHRLATIKNADRIYVLQEGRIQDAGQFEELLENSPQFREMIELQNL